MNDAFLLKDKENNKTQAELKKVSDKNSQLENKIKILYSNRDEVNNYFKIIWIKFIKKLLIIFY